MIAARNEFRGEGERAPPFTAMEPSRQICCSDQPKHLLEPMGRAPTNNLETYILSTDSQCTRSSAESDIQVSTEIPDIQLDSSETSNIRIPSSLHALANSFGSAEKHTPAGRGCLSYCLNITDSVLGSFQKVCGS